MLVVVVCCQKVGFKRQLLRYHLTIFNHASQECFLIDPLQIQSRKFDLSEKNGRQRAWLIVAFQADDGNKI